MIEQTTKGKEKNKRYADNQKHNGISYVLSVCGSCSNLAQWKSPVQWKMGECHSQVQKVCHLVNAASITNAAEHNTINRPLDPSRYLDRRRSFLTFLPCSGYAQFLQNRGRQPGPLFCHTVTWAQSQSELHRCLMFCRLDTSRYKGHSFRIGAACHTPDKIKVSLTPRFGRLAVGNRCV